MQSAHQDVESWHRLSSLAHDKLNYLDEVPSDCSTDIGDLDDSRHSDACSSESYLRADLGADVETLTIFDWDDTLFPTSWMQQQDLLSKELALLSNEQKAQLERLATCARQNLESAIRVGKVVVITNAEQGWLESTCKKFMPSLVSLMKTLDIVSARSTYQWQTSIASEWKRLAFADEVGFLKSAVCAEQYNVVSVGDSLHELQALLSVTHATNQGWGKSMKLMDAPSIEQLIEQHELLAVSFADVVDHQGDLDVEIGIEAND
jgi:hypothetical protein